MHTYAALWFVSMIAGEQEGARDLWQHQQGYHQLATAAIGRLLLLQASGGLPWLVAEGGATAAAGAGAAAAAGCFDDLVAHVFCAKDAQASCDMLSACAAAVALGVVDSTAHGEQGAGTLTRPQR